MRFGRVLGLCALLLVVSADAARADDDKPMLGFERSIAVWLKGAGLSSLSLEEAERFVTFDPVKGEVGRRKAVDQLLATVQRELAQVDLTREFTLLFALWYEPYARGKLPIEQLASPYFWLWSRENGGGYVVGFVPDRPVVAELSLPETSARRLAGTGQLPALATVRILGNLSRPPKFEGLELLRRRIGGSAVGVAPPYIALSLRVLAVDIYEPAANATPSVDARPHGALLAQLSLDGPAPVQKATAEPQPQLQEPGAAAARRAADPPVSLPAEPERFFSGPIVDGAAVRLGPASLAAEIARGRVGEPSNEFHKDEEIAVETRRIRALGELFEPDMEFTYEAQLQLSRYDFQKQRFTVSLPIQKLRAPGRIVDRATVLLGNADQLLAPYRCRDGACGAEQIELRLKPDAARALLESRDPSAPRAIYALARFRVVALRPDRATFEGLWTAFNLYGDDAHSELLLALPRSASSR